MYTPTTVVSASFCFCFDRPKCNKSKLFRTRFGHVAAALENIGPLLTSSIRRKITAACRAASVALLLSQHFQSIREPRGTTITTYQAARREERLHIGSNNFPILMVLFFAALLCSRTMPGARGKTGSRALRVLRRNLPERIQSRR